MSTAGSDLASRVEGALATKYAGAAVVSMAPLPGGASSLTYAADVENAPFRRAVVKVAPAGLAPVRNRDVLRQAKVFEILSGVEGIAVPTVLGSDPGKPPEVPPLFVMNYVEGESVEPLTEPDASNIPSPEVVETRALAAARMLARLHQVDVSSPAFESEPRSTLLGEVQRWTKTFDSLDDDLRPAAVDECRERLLSAVPRDVPPSLIHGDYRLGNMLCRGTSIEAVIDWEIWSLSDPRIDLAWFLLLADRSRPQNVRSEGGLPPVEHLLDEYESAAGCCVENLSWFEALVRYKQAAAAAFIAKNNRRREAGAPDADRHGAHGPALLDAALARLDPPQETP